MKDELVSFLTANMYKGVGFNEPSRVVYREDGQPYEIPYWEDDATNTEIDPTYWLENNYVITAPTQSLLQKWLREKHNIFIRIHSDYIDKHCIHLKTPNNDCHYYESIDNKNNFTEGSKLKIKYFSSYEEALEKGLQEGLYLIK